MFLRFSDLFFSGQFTESGVHGLFLTLTPESQFDFGIGGIGSDQQTQLTAVGDGFAVHRCDDVAFLEASRSGWAPRSDPADQGAIKFGHFESLLK